MKQKYHHIAYHKNGFVLITTLIAIAFLTTILVTYNLNVQKAVNTQSSEYTQAQLLHAAQGAIDVAFAKLSRDKLKADPTVLNFESSINNINIKCKVIDETGKININTLTRNNTLNRLNTDQFLNLIDQYNLTNQKSQLTYALAANLIDWIDTDNQPTILSFVTNNNTGAEKEWYEALTPSYAPNNHDITNPQTLLHVKGITKDTYYGQTNQESPCLKDLITLYGNGKINVNTAPKMVLLSLHHEMTPEIADTIIELRQHAPITSIMTIINNAGIPKEIYQSISESITTKSTNQYYQIIASAQSNNDIYTIISIVHFNQLTGPIKTLYYREINSSEKTL